jgi:hypothetical protein
MSTVTAVARNFSKPTLFFAGGPDPQDPVKADARHTYSIKAKTPVKMAGGATVIKDIYHVFKLVRLNMDVYMVDDRRHVLEGYYEFSHTTNAPGMA